MFHCSDINCLNCSEWTRVLIKMEKTVEPASLCPSSSAYVSMFYRNDTSVEPYPLQLPGCSLHCPLDDFVRITKLSISEDRDKECQLPSHGRDKGELFTRCCWHGIKPGCVQLLNQDFRGLCSFRDAKDAARLCTKTDTFSQTANTKRTTFLWSTHQSEIN